MCQSVKKSVTEAYKQHMTVKGLADATLKQQNMWPAAIADSSSHLHEDLVIPSSPFMTPPAFEHSVSSGMGPLPADHSGGKAAVGMRELVDSDSSSEGMKMHRFGGKLHDRNTRRLRSLPVENHMSTQDLLSAGQRKAGSSDVRLDVAA